MSDINTAPVALVTGASRGIGLETARGLASIGYHVIVGARRIDAATRAAAVLRDQGLDAEAIELDITSDDSRQAAAAAIEARHGRLDALVNNAGIWTESESASHDVPNRTSVTDERVLRDTFETNFFATVLLTQALLPLVRKAPAGRIVNVSSVHASLALQTDPSSPIYAQSPFAYAASKTALNVFTVQLARELAGTAIKVNTIHPGWVRTEMGGDAADLSVAEGAATSVLYATLPEDGPTGGFFYLDQPLPW